MKINIHGLNFFYYFIPAKDYNCNVPQSVSLASIHAVGNFRVLNLGDLRIASER